MKRLRRTPYIAVIIIITVICNACLLFAGDKTGESYKETPASEEDAFIKQMTENLRSVKNLKADFVQERHLSMFLDVLSSKGTLYFEAPDKLRWELKKPYASILIFNGGYVAKFNRENGKYVRMKLGMEDLLQEMLKQIISIMQGDFKKVREVYNISMVQGKDPRLIMRPLSAGMAKVIKSLELSIDQGTKHITKIVIREPQGDYIEIRFSGEQENSSLDQSLFDLGNPLTLNQSTSETNKNK